MKKTLAVLLIASVPAISLAENYPNVMTTFSAVEEDGMPEAKAYTMDLICKGYNPEHGLPELLFPKFCTLSVTTYWSCEGSSENHADSFNVSHRSYTTKDGSLIVKEEKPYQYALQFSVQQGAEYDYKLSLSFSDSWQVVSSAGIVTRRIPHNGHVDNTPIRGLKAPGDMLKRSCGIYLPTY